MQDKIDCNNINEIREERKQVRKKVEKEKISCLAKNRHAFEKR